MSQHNLQQLVKSFARGQKILDVFLTNCPHLWKQTSVFKSLVRSDHLSILVMLRIVVKPFRISVSFRDVREHRKLCMDKKMDQFDWERFAISDDPSDNVRRLRETLFLMFNECIPVIKDRMSSRDPPYMSPLVKNLCKIRKKNTRSHRESENHVLQERINELIRAQQIRDVNERRSSYHTRSRRWWNTVNMITGRQARNAPVSATIDPKTINLYFQSINIDDQYSSPKVLSIPDGTCIPTIEVHTVWKFLSTLKRTAPGPDEVLDLEGLCLSTCANDNQSI